MKRPNGISGLAIRLCEAAGKWKLAAGVAAILATSTAHGLEAVRFLTVDQGPGEAQADQQLHHELTSLSGNPVFTLFLNSFVELSLTAGVLYFASKPARDYSREFYQKLAEATLREDARGAETLTREVMQTSLAFWQAQAPKQEE